MAVKLIRADLAADPEFRARFAREVAAARHVSGMFTAPVVDADPDGPQPWLVTAYVPGPSLADAVAGHGPLPIRTVLTLAAGLAEGLGAIHAQGMVHRDLKPSNVLLAGDGPRIIDFGISRAADATALTRADLVVGSPGFMSPEQAQGQEVGPSSDIFSLGAVLTFAATGEGPFGTGSATALLYRAVHKLPATGGCPGRSGPWSRGAWPRSRGGGPPPTSSWLDSAPPSRGGLAAVAAFPGNRCSIPPPTPRRTPRRPAGSPHRGHRSSQWARQPHGPSVLVAGRRHAGWARPVGRAGPVAWARPVA